MRGMSDSLTWDEIEEIAASMGVSDEARRKWRERGGVPHRWRFPIAQAAQNRGKEVSEADLESPPKTEAA